MDNNIYLVSWFPLNNLCYIVPFKLYLWAVLYLYTHICISQNALTSCVFCLPLQIFILLNAAPTIPLLNVNEYLGNKWIKHILYAVSLQELQFCLLFGNCFHTTFNSWTNRHDYFILIMVQSPQLFRELA